jgi:hypothetical protein
MRVASARSVKPAVAFDVIAQDGFRRGHVAGEHRFDAFAEKRFAEFRVALDASADGCLEIASERHGCVSCFLRLEPLRSSGAGQIASRGFFPKPQERLFGFAKFASG